MGAHADQVMTVLMLFFLLGVLSRRIMQNPLSNGHTDRCGHGMLIVTALVDPRNILRAHSIAPACVLKLLAAPCGQMSGVTGSGQHGRVLPHHPRHPKPRLGGHCIG